MPENPKTYEQIANEAVDAAAELSAAKHEYDLAEAKLFSQRTSLNKARDRFAEARAALDDASAELANA